MRYRELVESASYTPRKQFLPLLVQKFISETGEPNPIATEIPSFPPDYNEFADDAKSPDEVMFYDENHIEVTATEHARRTELFTNWLRQNNGWLESHGWYLARVSLAISFERLVTDEEPVRGYLFHVTLADRLPSILRDGLQLRTSTDWGHDYSPRIYLVRRKRDAVFVMSKFADVDRTKDQPHRKYIILRIDLRHIPHHHFHVDPQTPGKGLYTLQPIPPDALSVIQP